MIIRGILLFSSLLLAFSGSWPVRAEGVVPPQVGRVGAADGEVMLRVPGDEWGRAGINDPVAAGMSVRTGSQGRLLLRIGGDLVALAPGSELDIAWLAPGGLHLVLRQGRVGLHLSGPRSQGGAEIDISRGGIWPLTSGDYDIAAGDQQTPPRLAVIDGRARFVGKGLDTTVATGAAALLKGGDAPAATAENAAPDGFAAWWQASAGGEAGPETLRHVSEALTGAHALDGSGRWESVDGYGAVWFPDNPPDGWTPYRQGHWRWVGPWGWTWIDDLPWGFAPSHYGRWARLAGRDGAERWGWVPGKRIAHPAYMPAAVAFLGTAGVGLSYPDANGPAIGWFPLAPGEAYWPSYAGDPELIRQVNEGSVDDAASLAAAAGGGAPADVVNGDYANRRFASVVPRAVFLGGRPVAAALLQLPERRLDNAPLLAGSPHIAPLAAASAAAHASPAKAAAAVRTLARILRPNHVASLARAAVRADRAKSARGAVASGRLRFRAHVAAAAARVHNRNLRLVAAHRRR